MKFDKIIGNAGEVYSASHSTFYKQIPGFIDIYPGEWGVYASAIGIAEDVNVFRKLDNLREWLTGAQPWIGKKTRIILYSPHISRVAYILESLCPGVCEVWRKRSGDVGRVSVGRVEIRDYNAIGLTNVPDVDSPAGVYEWTILTEHEIGQIKAAGYTVLTEIARVIRSCGGIENVPFSFSGYARAAVKACHIYSPPMEIRERDIAKEAYQGGACVVNRLAANQIIEGVDSYDLDSSYIAIMLSEVLPKGRGRSIYNKEIHSCRSGVWIGRVAFSGLMLRPGLVSGCIPVNRACGSGITGYDYVTKADYITWACASPMVDVVDNFYTYDAAYIIEGYEYRADYIPRSLSNVIFNTYKRKEMLKGSDNDYEYAQTKKILSSYYGLAGEYPEKLDSVSLSRRVLPYSWAPVITAYAQRAYWWFVYAAGESYLYGDTDSGKVLSGLFDESIITKYNNYRTEAIKRQFKYNRLDVSRETFARLGHWEKEETVDRIKILGRKCYIYESAGIVHGVISGVKKEYSRRVTFDKLTYGRKISAGESGVMAVMKQDGRTNDYRIDRDGIGGYVVQPCIYGEKPVPYTIGRDAEDDISDMIKERM